MKFVLAAAAFAAAFAVAAPASAQANTFSAGSFSLSVDKKPVSNVRSVEFVATNPPAMAAGRSAGTTFSLKVTITRTGDRTFDEWGTQTGALRAVAVNFLDRAGKAAGGYEFDRCVVNDWKWVMDATSNALATETWALNCATAKRS
jgi:hypothetical protein